VLDRPLVGNLEHPFGIGGPKERRPSMSVDFWNKRYAENEPAYGTEPNDFLVSEVNRFVPAADVLCLGEGEGRNAVFLAKRGMNVSALDYASAGLQRTRELARAQGVRVEPILADLTTFEPEENRYDGVIAIFVHLPPKERIRMHHAALRALRPHGVFIAEYFSSDQLRFSSGGPKDPTMLVRIDDLRQDFAMGRIERLEQQEVELREGRYHQGRASVVRIVVYRNL
jgi:SAM-dependent methyltransferase